ncbi:MAG: glycosyl transferase, family 2 [Bryobacterales bacterium]|nr:glycosyl transferase, family 2 [Bryobacterales bacterium]
MIWLGIPAALCSAYWALAIWAAGRRLIEKPGEKLRKTPPAYAPVSILKPVAGRDEAFYAAIRSHAAQDYPEFEILFGVRDPKDTAHADIRRLIAEYPSVPIRVMTEAPETPNGKAGMLVALAEAARFPVLLVNDSDILVERDYLRKVAAPLADPGVGLVTCLYRARGSSFPARFEAMGIALSFVPSLLVARVVGVAEFALGSTMVFRAEQLREIGGFRAIADYLADDYQLGARISATGRRVVLADCPVETNLGAGSWADVWKHQVRWARTVRVSRAGGYAGSVITHAALWSLVALGAGAWRVAAVCYALRIVAGALSARVVKARDVAWYLVPFRDLFETAIWAAGMFGNHVEWRGEKLKLRRDGTLARLV